MPAFVYSPAYSIATPPVHFVESHFIMKVMIHADICARLVVDAIHMLVEVRSMSIMIGIVVSDEEKRVNHLMQ